MIQKNMKQLMAIDKRGWQQDAVAGSIIMFIIISKSVFSTLLVACIHHSWIILVLLYHKLWF